MPPPATAAANESFVVGSIAHSMGSLNEVTIVEGQQFIGQESGEAGLAAATPTAVPESSSAFAVPLFGGAVHGSLFEDGGDSSDYFCGVSSVSEKGFLPACCRVGVVCVRGCLPSMRTNQTSRCELLPSVFRVFFFFTRDLWR